MKEEGVAKLLEVFGDKMSLYTHLLIGNRAGSIGEISAIAILIGGLFLLAKRYITWHIPVSFLGTAALMAWVLGGKGALFTGDPIVHLLSGGMMLGAWFMATDYVTSPSVKKGQIIIWRRLRRTDDAHQAQRRLPRRRHVRDTNNELFCSAY